MKTCRWKYGLVFAASLSLLFGCTSREEQHEVEARSIMRIMRILEWYDTEYPKTPPTNLAQVFAVTGQNYPYGWHQELAQFGKYAGFRNSIFEKYVFFPPGITNRSIRGELVLMNAKPYPGSEGLERRVVSKLAGVFCYDVLRERDVQRLFKEADIAEPIPPPMPSPPSVAPVQQHREPLSVKISNLIVRTAMSLGFTGDQALIVRLVVLGMPFVLLPLLAFGLWRRFRSRGQ